VSYAAENAREYPLALVEIAENSLQPRTAPAAFVGAIARRDKWFTTLG